MRKTWQIVYRNKVLAGGCGGMYQTVGGPIKYPDDAIRALYALCKKYSAKQLQYVEHRT